MKILSNSARLLVVCFLFTSCGVPYRPVNTSFLAYQTKVSAGPKAEVSYLYDVQRLTNNKRYAKKELKKGYASVALKVTNLSADKLVLTGENFKVTSNGTQIAVLTPEEYTKAVKQVAAAHLLHTLWGPWQITHIESPPPPTTTFKFVPIGAVVGLINMIIAATANTKHLTTMRNNELIGLTIEPGQTVHGIILMRSTGFQPLTFEISD